MSVPAARPPLPILTSLRFFAAAEVVAYHYSAAPSIPTDLFRGLAAGGYEAVTFFFVLSGFILTYVYTRAREADSFINVSTSEFWKARIARISPAYFLGLLLLLPSFVYSALIAKILPIELFILGLMLVPVFLQAWWPPAALLWNVPAWSLSVECFFYALFPVLAHATVRLSRNHLVVIAYFIVVAMTLVRSAMVPPSVIPLKSEVWHNFVSYFPLFHLPQFIFGMALGRLYLFGRTHSPKIHVSMFCIGAIGLVFVFGGRSLLPSWTQTDATLVLLFGLVIFGGARAEGAFKVFTFPSFILLGEASYSIYILHIPIWFWWNWFTRKIFHSSLPAFPNFAIYFALVVVASVLCYLYVEKPMRRWILGHREHRAA